MTKHTAYPTVEAHAAFPAIEGRVLARWEREGTFVASVSARPTGSNGDNEFVFYDGPPFANGLPHYGHLLTGYVKDVVPRYQTMRGRHVERRFGWDCHGLPAEVEAEKQLGLQHRSEIVDMGVGVFNEVCRTSVLRYTNEWERYVTRQARWVDFTNDYKTLDLPYMESVMWAFKTLYDKGLIYEGFKVLPYCFRCETPLSNTETRMDDVYKNRQDPAVTVAFRLDSGEDLWIWTTTPWTLPSNLAVAVGFDIDYAVMERDGHRVILAEARLGGYAKELAGYTQVETVAGRALADRAYTPPFDYFVGRPNVHRVLVATWVTTEDGTGVVHLAPGFGEDDQTECAKAGIDVVVPVDSQCRFTSEVPDFEGLQVFEANTPVVRRLREAGLLVRLDSYDHSYPHCWRCNTALVYRAISSWFVEVTKVRDRMVALNQDITWVPDHVKAGSFGKWVANARDWSISRNRFWGSPIPVWKSDDPRYPRLDVYGSVADLERDFGVTVTDLHRPLVDDLVRPNPDDPTGQSKMVRVPEVLDCWFESGSMPFAQVHYPFENREWFEDHYPGDFIVEYIGQTRGWFYTLHVLATALFDRPAFSTCLAHGIVLGNDGQKMSKSLKNYPDPYEMFDTYGADAMRWFLMSSPIVRGGDLIVTEPGIRDSVRQVLLPLWNAWYFFTLYANTATEGGYTASYRTDQTGVLDRYVLAKLHDVVADTTEAMDRYDLYTACGAIRSFLDVLTNWYIRRSRDRFWGQLTNDSRDAFDTLYTALHVLTRVAAPLLPLLAEEIFGGLTGGESVHLTDWPTTDDLPTDAALVAAMDRVRDVCSTGSSVRKARGLRVRLPLAHMQVTAAWAESLAPYASIIADELNVKSPSFTANISARADYQVKLIPGTLGPRLGEDMKRVMAAFRAKDFEPLAIGVRPVIAGVELEDGEYELRLIPTDPDSSALLSSGDGVVWLDTQVTPVLEQEGLARDLVRMVQQARRDAGLNVSDRITLSVRASQPWLDALRLHQALVTDATLASSLSTHLDDACEEPLVTVAAITV
jgi:isoleucyl-tRNA synthetase